MLNILITGANGQLGRSLQRLGCVSPHNYICTDVAELDITDAGAVLRAVREQGIDVIVNCAAYTDVERAEDDEPTAELLNHKAAGNLAAAAKATGATLFHVSTARPIRPIQRMVRPRRWEPTGARSLQANAPSWRPGAGI